MLNALKALLGTSGGGPVDTNLEGYWPFATDSGTDASGNGNTLDVTNGTRKVIDWGPVGSCLEFESNARYAIDDTIVTDWPATMTCFFKSSAGRTDFTGGGDLGVHLMGWFDKSDNNVYEHVLLDQGFLKWSNAQNTTPLTTETVIKYNDGAWHFLMVVIRSNTDREIYIDGVSVLTVSSTRAFGGTWDSFCVGRSYDSNALGTYKTGPLQIAECKLFSKAFNDTEALDYYNSYFPYADQSKNMLPLGTDHLVFDVDLQDTSGDDAAPGNNDMTTVGTLTTTTGPLSDSAVDFDAGGEYMHVTPGTMPLDNYAFALSCWLKIDHTNTGTNFIFGFYESGNYRYLALLVINENLSWGFRTSVSDINYQSNLQVSDDTWRFIQMAKWDNNRIRLYADGHPIYENLSADVEFIANFNSIALHVRNSTFRTNGLGAQIAHAKIYKQLAGGDDLMRLYRDQIGAAAFTDYGEAFISFGDELVLGTADVVLTQTDGNKVVDTGVLSNTEVWCFVSGTYQTVTLASISTLSHMLRESIYGQPVTVELTGLEPSTEYDVRVWGYSTVIGAVYKYYVTVGELLSADSTTEITVIASPQSGTDNSTEMHIKSSSGGRITIQARALSGESNGRFNGIFIKNRETYVSTATSNSDIIDVGIGTALPAAVTQISTLNTEYLISSAGNLARRDVYAFTAGSDLRDRGTTTGSTTLKELHEDFSFGNPGYLLINGLDPNHEYAIRLFSTDLTSATSATFTPNVAVGNVITDWDVSPISNNNSPIDNDTDGSSIVYVESDDMGCISISSTGSDGNGRINGIIIDNQL